MKNILILYDYKGYFATKFVGSVEKHKGTTIDVSKLKQLFEQNNFNVVISEMSQVDFSRRYDDWYIIYASSEDAGLFYKEYIEDVLCALQRLGAILIPSFDYFRAHNNKSYQEMMRKGFKNNSLKHPAAYSVGQFDEIKHFEKKINYPAVVKVANGAGSKGVVLVKNSDELESVAIKLMTHTYRDFEKTLYVRMGLFAKRFTRRVSGWRINNETLFTYLRTNKIIIEDYIPNLKGDNKVLYFGGKYFILSRANRDNDFRASGSGKFTYPEGIEEVRQVLNLAKAAVDEINMPMTSLDIGQNNTGSYLLEYQCVCFGPYTLQYAPHCYMYRDGEWVIESGHFDLEEEYARSIGSFIRNGSEV